MKFFTNAHFLLTLTSIFWAFNTIAGRAAVGEVSPLLIVSIRWFFVSIILTIICRKELRKSWSILNSRLKWLTLMGLFGFTGFNSTYYIAAHDTHLAQGDLPAEPGSALIGGETGLEMLEHIVIEAPSYLRSHGWLLLEHGFDQAEQVRALLTNRGFSNVAMREDWSGQPRISGGQWLN